MEPFKSTTSDETEEDSNSPRVFCCKLRIGWSCGPCFFPFPTRKLRPALVRELQELTSEHEAAIHDHPNNTTPLHIACLKHYSNDLIIKYLLKTYEDAVFEENDDFELPLHYALKDEEGATDEVIDALLKIHPRAAEARTADQDLPIHSACFNGTATPHAIQRLIEIYPLSLLIESNISLPFDEEMRRHAGKKDPYQDSNDVFIDNAIIVESEAQLKSNEHKPPLYLCKCIPAGDASSSLEGMTTTTGTETDSLQTESGFIPLHLAILSGASPEIIQCILQTKPNSLTYETTQGRTPMDCARYIVRGRLSDDDHDNLIHVKNAFAAIEIMESVDTNRRKAMRARQKSKLTNEALTSMRNVGIPRSSFNSFGSNNFDAGLEFQKFMISVSLAVMKSTLLGQLSEKDEEYFLPPQNVVLPKQLKHHNIAMDLPVGFRRLRWALLSSKSRFIRDGFLRNKMRFSQIEEEAWDKCDQWIGLHDNPAGIDEREFLNAKKKRQYLMPKSGLIGENMAYADITLLDYNDYCFVINTVTKNPDVPYGDTFCTHTLAIYTNLGNNQSHMQASTQVEFHDKPPIIAWKIKSGAYSGTTDFFASQGECICQHAAE